MAFGEHLVYFVNRLPAIAGRMAWPERRRELRTLRLFPPEPPAGETPGLARQIIECQLEGLEPAADALRIDQAIGWRGYGRSWCWPKGIIREDMNARRISRVPDTVRTQLGEVFARIEEPEGGT